MLSFIINAFFSNVDFNIEVFSNVELLSHILLISHTLVLVILMFCI